VDSAEIGLPDGTGHQHNERDEREPKPQIDGGGLWPSLVEEEAAAADEPPNDSR